MKIKKARTLLEGSKKDLNSSQKWAGKDKSTDRNKRDRERKKTKKLIW